MIDGDKVIKYHRVVRCWTDMQGDAGGALVESAPPLKTDPLTADFG